MQVELGLRRADSGNSEVHAADWNAVARVVGKRADQLRKIHKLRPGIIAPRVAGHGKVDGIQRAKTPLTGQLHLPICERNSSASEGEEHIENSGSCRRFNFAI